MRAATVMRPDPAGLGKAGEWIRAGKCVAFPTGAERSATRICPAGLQPTPHAQHPSVVTSWCFGAVLLWCAETVYGLGAHALDEKAVLSIFKYKGRPLTDPLIVHVTDTESARALVKLDAGARTVFDALASAFWPGPLTLVVPAADVIPDQGECAETSRVRR
jgi:tRNA A37 threonylcarbamoyladenosine synthetase subunit TsaC/SUA5/YrdC